MSKMLRLKHEAQRDGSEVVSGDNVVAEYLNRMVAMEVDGREVKVKSRPRVWGCLVWASHLFHHFMRSNSFSYSHLQCDLFVDQACSSPRS